MIPLLRSSLPAACLLAIIATHASAAIETAAGFDITAAPTSATLISGSVGEVVAIVDGPPVGQVVTFEDALTGAGIIDDGIANAATGTVIELTFASAILNAPGDDFVLFEARFDDGSFSIRTDADGFATELALPSASLTDTGENVLLFFNTLEPPAEPFGANVFAVSFDLDDLGVAPGDSVSSLRVTAVDDQTDLLGVGALSPPVPEPTTLAVWIGLSSAVVATRRTRR